MARIRTIKPEFWSHPVMGRLEPEVMLISLAVLNLADDEGFFLADPILVRNFARPFSESSVSIQGALNTLSKVGWIEVKNHPTHGPIGRVINFEKHQNVNRASTSKIKSYFLSESSVSPQGTITEPSSLEQGTGNREQGKEINPPTPFQGESKKKPGKGKAKGEELDRYPQELHEAMSTWRGLIKSLKDPEVQSRFSPEKRFLPVAVGTVENTWRAWEKHLGKTVQGNPVTHGDVLSAVRMWAEEKFRRAMAEENPSLSAPMLPTMINHADFVDAVVRSVKTRIAEEEVAHAS